MKQKKTARELEALIQARFRVGLGHIQVHSSPVFNWDASGPFMHPNDLAVYKPAFDEVVRELRGLYDLDEAH
jgi:hypothetical protein